MAKACLLGLDIGSSSIKVSLVDADTKEEVASSQSPENELSMISHHPGWAEQDPESWWLHVQLAVNTALKSARYPEVKSIGISYQMHGLVLVDKEHRPLRPSIIWCDSRAIQFGEDAYQHLGEDYCQHHLLNSPGNFTGAKLQWVKVNEPHLYKRIYKMMLPGDYIAMKLTGKIQTTNSGLSEAMLWDFKHQSIASSVLDYWKIDHSLIPDVVPTFSVHGVVQEEAAQALGLPKGVPVTYRAGDQPNNSLSLNVLRPGETAATAGTSGVIYSVTSNNVSDQQSRVNTFVHVNNHSTQIRNGVLMCINGTGIANSWLRKLLSHSYEEMNSLGHSAAIGSEGLVFLPFGNGAERVFQNRMLGASWAGLDFNHHQSAHLVRSVQEGIAFALRYGFEVMNQLGVASSVIRAGRANLFLSPLFREAFVNAIGVPLELIDTHGAKGAALASGVGVAVFNSVEEALRNTKVLQVVNPEREKGEHYEEAYQRWRNALLEKLN